MADCAECGETTEGCGCQQEALHISQICNPVVCPSNECSESFDANCVIYTGEDIACGVTVLATSGENISQMVANLVAFFCATEGTTDAISCGGDEVVPVNTSFGDALPLIVAYFCAEIVTVAGDITTIEGDITTIQGDITTIQGDVTALDSVPEISCSEPSPYVGGGATVSIVVPDATALDSALSLITAYYCTKVAELNAEIFKRRALFTATADAVITNSAANLTLVGAGLGSMTVPADGFVAGDTFRLKLTGDRVMGFATTINVTIRIGAVVIGTIPLGSSADNAWAIEAEIVIRTIGAAGTVQLGASFSYDGIGVSVAQSSVIDTTNILGSEFNVYAQYGTADASNTITSRTVSLTKLY
jgi:hypothetical protein